MLQRSLQSGQRSRNWPLCRFASGTGVCLCIHTASFMSTVLPILQCVKGRQLIACPLLACSDMVKLQNIYGVVCVHRR
jgi:hypothetical protein